MASNQAELWVNPDEFPMKKMMDELIEKIRSDREEAGVPFTTLDEAKRAIALSIAEGIDRGNRKGRATANEHEQLDRLIEQLAGSIADEDESGIPADVREMLASFEYHAPATARPGSTAPGDDAA